MNETARQWAAQVDAANTVRAASTPPDALLIARKACGDRIDCFIVDVAGEISISQFIEAFYLSRAFLPERLFLAALLRTPATPDAVRALAAGARDEFTAWTVENRNDREILLCDFQKFTRSWLMAAPGPRGTRLYFGSSISPAKNPRRAISALSLFFVALRRFHEIYSRLLLASAANRLARNSAAARVTP